MKNVWKRIMSAVLCVVMVLSALPGVVFNITAMADEEKIVLTPIADSWTGDSTANCTTVQGIQIDGTKNEYRHLRLQSAAGSDLSKERYATSMGYMKYDMSDFTDVKVKKVTLNFYARSNSSAIKNAKMYFFKMSNDWDESTLTYSSAPVTPLKGTNIMVDITGKNIEGRVQPQVVSPEFSVPASTADYALVSFDITNLINKYNLINDPMVSFAMLAHPTGYSVMAVTKDHENEELHPYIEVETEEIENLYVVDSTEGEITHDSEIKISFNNLIDATTATPDSIELYEEGEKIELSQDDIIVNDTDIIIQKEKLPYMDYEVVVTTDVCDIYGGNLNEAYKLYIKTLSTNIEVTYNNIFNSALLNSDAPDSTRITNSAGPMYKSGVYYPYYVEMDVSDLYKTATAVKSAIYKVKFNSTNKAFKVSFYYVDEDFDPETVTYNTAPEFGDVFLTQLVGVNTDYVDFDITEFVNEKLSKVTADDPYIRFGIKSNAATVSINTDLADEANRPKIAFGYTDSSFLGITSSMPENGDWNVKIDTDITIEFSSAVNEVKSSNFILKNTATDDEVILLDREIEYNPVNYTVTINPDDDLEELMPYELIITGISSAMAQMKTKTLKFTTASRFESGELMLIGADSISAGSEIIADVEVENNTYVDAVAPVVALVLYDGSVVKEIAFSENDENIPANDLKGIGASIIIPDDAKSTSGYWAKAFLWNSADSQKPLSPSVCGGNVFEIEDSKGRYFGDVLLSGVFDKASGAEITLKVCDESGDIVHIDQCTADSNGKYEFVLSLAESGDYTAYVLSEKNLDELQTIQLDGYATHEDMIDIWEQINSDKKSEVKEVVEASVKCFGFDIQYDLNPILDEVSEDIANHSSFGKYTVENIDSYGRYLYELCQKFTTINELFESIYKAKNHSVVGEILSDKNNAELLGISKYYEDYKDNKTEVNKALIGKSFDSLDEFEDAFKDALDDANYEPPKKSSGGGGGGSSKSSIIINAAPVNNQSQYENDTNVWIEEDYFTDSKYVSWARKEIEFLYRMGVISGKGERKFAPDDNVLREEYVKLIMLASELHKEGIECNFSDVKTTDWFYPYVASAVDNQVVKGISETVFGSGTEITRQDLCVMTVRVLEAMGYPVQATKESSFADSSLVSDYAKDSIAFLNENGIVNGDNSGNFKPHNKATRAETACIIYRVLDHMKNNASLIWKPDDSGNEQVDGEYTFQSPSKAQIKSDIENKLKDKSHPFIHADREKIESVKQSVENKDDEYILNQYEKTKARADALLTQPVTAVNGAVSQSLIAVRANVLNLMVVYFVEGDERYLNRAKDEFNNIRTITNWASGAQLDNTVTAEALATCYDWLYDYLTEEERKWAETTLKEKALQIAYRYYRDPNELSVLRAENSNMNIVLQRGSFNHTVYNNSNILIAALALAKLDPDYSAFIISNALYNIEPYWELVKEGGFEEPSTYYHYCSGRAGYAMSALYSALDTMYDYEKSPGFKNTAWFGLYMYGPMTFGDCSPTKSSYDTNSLYIYAKHSRNAQMMKRIIDLDKGSNVDPLLWYDKGEHSRLDTSVSIPLDRLLAVPDQSTYVMRNHSDDDTNIFTGLYAGCGNATGHSDAVSGLFCLDAYGERWITALGFGDYNLPGYYDNGQNGQRWTYYERRTEAGSCLVINPSEDVGQDVTKSATIIDAKASEGSSYAIADLEPVYHREVTSYKRGLKLHNNRTQIVVQDEAVMKKPSKIFWSFNTPADVEIIDNSTAVMSIGSKRVVMKVSANVEYELYKMKAESLPTSPKAAGQKVFRQYRKIAISASDVTELKLMVEFTPIASDMQFPEKISDWIDLESWTAEEIGANKPTLEALYVDGKKLEGFEPLNYFYAIDSETYRNVPEITADKEDTYNMNVIYPETYPGMIYVEVADGSGNVNYYSIDALVKEKPLDVSSFRKLNVVKVDASDNDGNIPANAVDGDAKTRWSASGEGEEPYLELDLGSVEKVAALGISFYQGSSRSSYFEILTSTDGRTWTKHLENAESSGKSSDFENFSLSGTQARYIRYVGQQNSLNHWNSVTDIIVYGE